jgi:hypothetical protein
MGKKMIGQKDDQYFLPNDFLLKNGLLLQRSTDGALARISGLSPAAGRCCKAPKLNPSLKFWVVISRRSKTRCYFGTVP